MASAPGESGGGRVKRGASELVRLVSRLLVAQAVATAAVGLPFSRRHLPSILITLGMVAAVAGLAVLARTAAPPAWAALLAFEAGFFLYGLLRFMFSRYVGGTLFALIAVSALAHPAVARAYGVRWGRTRRPRPVAGGSAEAPESFGGEALGEENLGGHPVA